MATLRQIIIQVDQSRIIGMYSSDSDSTSDIKQVVQALSFDSGVNAAQAELQAYFNDTDLKSDVEASTDQTIILE